MRVGFCSCCLFKYDFIVYMVHGIISRGICFNYYGLDGIFSVAYGALYK